MNAFVLIRGGGDSGRYRVRMKFVPCARVRFFPPELRRKPAAGRPDLVPAASAAGDGGALSRPEAPGRMLEGYATDGRG